MASYAQLKANRDNAKKSTGPRTAAGKTKSRKNAVRHGLFSEHLFVDGDEQEGFALLLDDLEAHLAPEGPLEIALVERIAIGMWRQRRLNTAEGAMVRLYRRDEYLNHQHSLAPPRGRTFPGQGARSSQFRGREEEAEKTAHWITALLKEKDALSQPTFEAIEKDAPNIYAHLKSQAEEKEVSAEKYLDKLPGGTEEFLNNLAQSCAETMKHIKEARAEASFKQDLRNKAYLPRDSDLLARYQTMIDNQLYKALQEYRQLQDWRLNSLELTIGHLEQYPFLTLLVSPDRRIVLG